MRTLYEIVRLLEISGERGAGATVPAGAASDGVRSVVQVAVPGTLGRVLDDPAILDPPRPLVVEVGLRVALRTLPLIRRRLVLRMLGSAGH